MIICWVHCELTLVIKMLRNSQQIANDAANKIIQRVEQNIESLEKVSKGKPAYSAKQIFEIMGEINDQISYAPDIRARLQTPKDLPSLKQDSYMSVYNVETPIVAPRHRSQTKTYRRRKSTMEYEESLLTFRKKRRITYNKIEALPEQAEKELNWRPKQIQEEQSELQNKFRAELEKKIEEIKDEKKLKTRAKFLSVQELKQKFSYDYDSKRMKVKNQFRNNLITNNKSLLGDLSKHILKKSLPHKLDKPEVRTLETTKVLQKMARKTKKSRNQIVELIETQPIDVQFSQVNSLTQRFLCQPGVSFRFGGELLKSRKIRTLANDGEQPRKLSRLDFLLEKKRSASSNARVNLESLRTLSNESQTLQSQRKNLTIDTQKSYHRSSSKISIQNFQMHQYLLTPESQPTQLSLTSETKEIEKPEPVPLDTNDRFNINYIKGIVNKGRTQGKIELDVPNIQRPREPFLKVREKLGNKMAFIVEMKRKFQDALRNDKPRLDLQTE